MKKKTTYFDEIVYYKLLEAEQEAEEVSLRYSSEDVLEDKYMLEIGSIVDGKYKMEDVELKLLG